MSGNVFEWCYDWYDTVNSSTADTGASSSSYRVMRGGSWCLIYLNCEVFRRFGNYPYYRKKDDGFRVVRTK